MAWWEVERAIRVRNSLKVITRILDTNASVLAGDKDLACDALVEAIEPGSMDMWYGRGLQPD